MVTSTVVESYGSLNVLGLFIFGVKALLIILVIYVLILAIKALKKYLKS
jgi:hypothetical protein